MKMFMAIFALVVACGLNWIVTCGIVNLITLCFGLVFKWRIATGIWFIIIILKSIFNVTVKKELMLRSNSPLLAAERKAIKRTGGTKGAGSEATCTFHLNPRNLTGG